mgnify:FL=1
MDKFSNGINTILWDWNGTLLNDVEVCVASMNTLLSRRNIRPLSLDKYRSIFRFPVESYYNEAGIDLNAEPFDRLASEYMELYHENIRRAPLHAEARFVLDILKSSGFRQYLISAMEHRSLVQMLRERELDGFFDRIHGIEDHYAVSKLDSAVKLASENRIDMGNTCLIGDTDHDKEVADALGCRCILIASGHQARERLEAVNSQVASSLTELYSLLGIKD